MDTLISETGLKTQPKLRADNFSMEAILFLHLILAFPLGSGSGH